MQSAQESKQELEAAIRYAENAISSAKQTIESMEFRQEMAKKNFQEQTGREEALQNQLNDMRASAFEDAKTIEKLQSEVNALEQPERPTMPVIPKAVAIAIFREGMAYGAGGVCDEIQGETINVCENEYCGDFEVTFAKTSTSTTTSTSTGCVARPLTTATKSGLWTASKPCVQTTSSSAVSTVLTTRKNRLIDV